MSSLAFVLLLMFLCFASPTRSRGLQQTGDDVVMVEAAALLAFRQSSIQSDPNRFLSGWASGMSYSMCSWNGVSCNDQGRVEKLDFQNACLGGCLQLSDLMPLTKLTTLLFAGNSFSGNLRSPDNNNISGCNFQFVDLSFNALEEPLAANHTFALCHNLVYLNLSHNLIPGGSLPFGPSLFQLDLSANRISDSGLAGSVLSGCQNLNLLNLSDNRLSGPLPGSISSCRRLSTLDLSSNHFSGDVPARFLTGPVQSLAYLDLSGNNLTGDFQNFNLGFCRKLWLLNLSQNRLSGLPPSLANCSSLKSLDVSHNLISHNIPGHVLGKMKGLKSLNLANNNYTGEIPDELSGACTTLEQLDLSGNQLIGGLPPGFVACSSLYSLNLGNNQLSGDFLDTVVSSLNSLHHLYLPFNNITGPIPRSLANCTQLQELDLSSNALTGSVPSDLCSAALQRLMLANNYLSGSVPSGIGLCKNLEAIDLSFNALEGPIPDQIWTLPHLLDVVMWANSLTGEIPELICTNGGNLQTLILNNNALKGSIPKSIANCTNLIWVTLASNRISGEIPADIGNLQQLAILQLGNNSLSGTIPPGIGKCRSLIWVDLNSNELTGFVPGELGLISSPSMNGRLFATCRGAGGLVEFDGIRKGRLAAFFPLVQSCSVTRLYSNGSLIYLDLSYNRFSGTIPDELGTMPYLQVLNLGHNELTGEIPFSFGGLNAVGILDLSHNGLSGLIPGSLVGLSSLSDFDVSNNSLFGPIPVGGQLTNLPAAKYGNNTGLCGGPLPPCSQGLAHKARTLSRKWKTERVIIGMVVGFVFSLTSILLLLYALFRVRSRKTVQRRESYIESLATTGTSSWKLSGVLEPLSINVAAFEKPLRKLTFAHLLEATNGFSADSVIGSGGFGDVYKAQLKDGSMVAIKKLIPVAGQGDREFVAEMETIGKIKHRNLVPLLGYCTVGDERLLVYDYMRYGSLDSVLHDQDGVQLDWPARKKIAIGSARGLAFLHHSCIPHIIHRDMKSSNVLLDENFEARLSDFGMARLVCAVDTHLTVSGLAGTPGYVPPEYYQSFRCTAKGDVYSYGVVLLELLSGKKPIDTAEFGDDNNLVGWAKQLYRERNGHKILDPALIGSLSENTELCHYLKIALDCLQDKAFQRPTMNQVVARFKELQSDCEGDHLDAISEKNSAFDSSE